MWLLALVLAYLIGSLPTAYLVARYVYGFDIRRRGSGNVGATNALRTMGTVPGLIVLVTDVFKGVLAVWIGCAAGGQELAALTAFLVLLGHNWSIFLSFKGGRGVATAAGAILILAPAVLFWLVIIWITIILVTRYVSLGSIIAASLAPILMIIFHRPWPYILFTFASAVLIIYCHRANIKRLLSGTEHRLGERI